MGRYHMGTVEEIEEILDFANMVFSMSHSSTDFSRLLPKAYSEGRYERLRHHMIKEGDKIRALVDIYPVTLDLDGDRLEAAYIGTVSVHPKSRQKGYMIELMERAEKDARALGCALMLLDGNRHRYQHYGFERAGIRYVFRARLGNVAHCCDRMYEPGYMQTPAYSFEEVDADSPYTGYLFSLYARRHVTARAQEDFLLCLASSQAAAYAILRGDRPVGYFNISEDGKEVFEFEIDKICELPRAVYDLMMGLELTELVFAAGPDEIEKLDCLDKMSDSYQAALSHQVRILDHVEVLRFLLRWKHRYCTLAAGQYVIGIREPDGSCEKRYRLSVHADTVEVAPTDGTPDAVLEEMELVRLLTTSSFFVDQSKGSAKRIKNAPVGWFPLPFYLPDADAF